MKKHEAYRFYLATALSMIFILLPIGGVGGSTYIRRNHKSMLPSINVPTGNIPPKLANSSPLQNNAGLTSHFRSWLAANGYSGYDFARDDAPGGSYGGKQNDSDTVINQPVIFIHGNSDSALGTGASFRRLLDPVFALADRQAREKVVEGRLAVKFGGKS